MVDARLPQSGPLLISTEVCEMDLELKPLTQEQIVLGEMRDLMYKIFVMHRGHAVGCMKYKVDASVNHKASCTCDYDKVRAYQKEI